MPCPIEDGKDAMKELSEVLEEVARNSTPTECMIGDVGFEEDVDVPTQRTHELLDKDSVEAAEKEVVTKVDTENSVDVSIHKSKGISDSSSTGSILPQIEENLHEDNNKSESADDDVDSIINTDAETEHEAKVEMKEEPVGAEKKEIVEVCIILKG